MRIKELITNISNLSMRWKMRLVLFSVILVTLVYTLISKITMSEQDVPKTEVEVISAETVITHNNEALVKDFIYENEINTYVHDMDKFKKLIITYSNELEVPYEWFICAIKSESNFNPLASNSKGSGAIGFIQFMPFNYSSDEFDNLTKNQFINLGWEQQLYYTFRYLKNRVDSKNEKNIYVKNFTDFYMIIFYPEAVGKKDNFEIARYYTNNKTIKKRYIQNSGCDMYTTNVKVVYDKNNKIITNPDKILTKRDMQVWLYNRFPQAYNLNKQ